jgi:aldose 1-epimerase
MTTNHPLHLALLLGTTFALGACAAAPVQLSRQPFGTLSNGTAVEAVVLKNNHGMAVTLITYGATVQSLRFPDRRGVDGELALGFDTLAGYENTPGFTNVTVGRYANRIAGGQFSLDGRRYPLAVNEAPNTLHGGNVGWDKRNWTIKQVARTADAASVTFTLTSPDGDQGFPGSVVTEVSYELNDNNDMTIRYSARTDKPTVINLTYHSMLNLSGLPATRLATDAELTIESDAILPVDKMLIPASAGMPVAGTPFDFRRAANVSERLRMQHPQLALANGIDHTYMLRGGRTATPKAAVTLEQRDSGRGLKITTTEPGMQVYTGNFLDGKVPGKGGQRPVRHQSISFEAQGYPDSPNQPGFPSTRLDPGQEYRQTTVLHLYTLPR